MLIGFGLLSCGCRWTSTSIPDLPHYPAVVVELEETIHIPADCTLQRLDLALKSYVTLCSSYHGASLRFWPCGFRKTNDDCGFILCFRTILAESDAD